MGGLPPGPPATGGVGATGCGKTLRTYTWKVSELGHPVTRLPACDSKPTQQPSGERLEANDAFGTPAAPFTPSARSATSVMRVVRLRAKMWIWASVTSGTRLLAKLHQLATLPSALSSAWPAKRFAM